MNITRVFSRRRVRKARTRRTFHKLAITALSGAILLTSNIASAEIYRWKDANGMIRYSNRPPDDPALLMDAMPLKQPPLEQRQQGSSYYLQSTGKEEQQQEFSGNQVERLILPPQAVDPALANTAETPVQPPDQDDAMAALLSRMTELEQRLEQTTDPQTDWDVKYQQTLLQTEQLEQQNRLLHETITDMQLTLKQYETIIASSQQETIIQPAPETTKTSEENTDLNQLLAMQSQLIEQQQLEIAQLRQDMQALQANVATPSLSSGAASSSASPKIVTRGRIRVVERKTRRQEIAQISNAETHLFLSQR